MPDQFRFHTIDELEALSLDELTALWELVPTERQRAYRAAYERQLAAVRALGSDAREHRVVRELIKQYRAKAIVPAGSLWVQPPTRVQAAARADTDLTALETDTRPAGNGSHSRQRAIGAAVIALAVGFLLLRLLGGRTEGGESGAITQTPTLDASFTPTALALEQQDDVIQGGDVARETAYPVSLHITTGTTPPRVWVVQRRRVQTSEWRYDPNPDTASYLAGMAVRPVIGIPWSEDNARLLAGVDAGTQFTLTMNTGAVLHFTVESHRMVRRSETDIFRQIAPGLMLLLIGETDVDGLPTAERLLISAAYSPDQELTRSGELVSALPTAIPFPTLTPTIALTVIPFADLNVQIIRVTFIDGEITASIRLYNGGTQAMHFAPEDMWIAFGYVENPPGPRLPAVGIEPFDLLPSQAADVTLVWAWNGEPYASLGVGAWRFGIRLTTS